MEHNINLTQGIDYSTEFHYKDSDGVAVNMTGYSVASKIRDFKDEELATPTVAISDAVNGFVSFALSAVQTDELPLTPPRHVYDVVITNPSGHRMVLVGGEVRVSKTVTRA
jgi:hypothetical protein